MPQRQIPVTEKFCERCGIPLNRKRYPGGDLESRNIFLMRRFCSLRCASLRGNWGKSTSAARRVSHALKGTSCEICGKITQEGQSLHVHHVNGNIRDNRPENLRTFCVSCHMKNHNPKKFKRCQFCKNLSRKHGMCQKHYQRWEKYGDPFLTKKRKPGTDHEFVIVRD